MPDGHQGIQNNNKAKIAIGFGILTKLFKHTFTPHWLNNIFAEPLRSKTVFKAFKLEISKQIEKI